MAAAGPRRRRAETTGDDTTAPDGSGALSRNARDFVQSLDRGLAVIRAFGPGHTHLTLSDVARSTNLTRAAVRRFLLTLVELGYVDFDGRLFSLRPQVLELGYSYMSTLPFADIAVPAMRELVERVSVSASMTVLDGSDAVYVAHVSAKRMLAITVTLGTRVPAYATALGQVLLSGLNADEVRARLGAGALRAFTASTVTDRDDLIRLLDTVRQRGYALGDEGFEAGLRSLAVPITDARGAVIASLGISTQAGGTTREQMRKEMLPELLATAAQLDTHVRNTASPVA